MRLTYHVMFPKALLPTIFQWQKACTDLGFAVEFEAQLLMTPLSDSKLTAVLSYRETTTKAQVYTSPISDVADICDELHLHITKDQDLAVTIEFNDDSENLPPVSMTVAAMAKLTNAMIYIEGDGTFCTADEAVETANGWEKQGKS